MAWRFPESIATISSVLSTRGFSAGGRFSMSRSMVGEQSFPRPANEAALLPCGGARSAPPDFTASRLSVRHERPGSLLARGGSHPLAPDTPAGPCAATLLALYSRRRRANHHYHYSSPRTGP